MAGFSVILAYDRQGQIVPIATVTDADLLRGVLTFAVAEAERRAAALETDDPALAVLERGEAEKLRSVLAALTRKAASNAVQ